MSDEATVPLDFLPIKEEKASPAMNHSSSDSESDGNEQALISASEWRSTLKRLSKLEARVLQLQAASASFSKGSKRPREDQDYEDHKVKKAKLSHTALKH